MTDRLDLRGQWQVFLDPEDIGLNEQWFLPQQLAGRQAQILNLPGSLEQAGIGDTITSRTEWVGSQFGTEFVDDPLYAPYRKDDDFRFPYWLQPETRYVGPAWYVKHITLPETEVDHWQLILERPHWETRVWINGRYAGSNDSLCVPHRYHLDASLHSGGAVLVIRVDNRMIREVGPNAHSISDQTQGPWNGIVGELSLKPVGSVSLGEIQVYPNFKQSSALAQVEIQNHLEQETSCMLKVGSTEYPLVLQAGASRKMHVEMYNLATYLWDEFAPNLATLHFQLFDASDSEVDQYHCKIGFRSVETQAKHIFVNGKQVFLRGTVECCVFPKTGAPPTEEGPWEEIFAQSKAFGLNHIRFHSWCPPDAAFRVADRMGFYLQVECPIWKNQGVAYGDDESFDDWLFGESERIVCEYGNHPSFLFFASGNEPSGRDKEVLGLWASYWNQRDTRRLHTSASGWPALAENAYQVVPEPRIQAWGEGLDSRINAKRPETVTNYDAICEKYPGPVVTHEMGQWCVFPDFSEIDAYTGYLKPKNFEIFADILKRRGMYEQARQFLYASGFQQVLCYKEEIEAALRTENLSGIQLLALTDFPGQGTALEGVLNVFWQEKGYCTADQFRMFCNDIVLLAGMERRTYVFGESFTPKLRIANFGKEDSIKPIVQWKLSEEEGKTVGEGTVECNGLLKRGLSSLSTVSLSLTIFDTAKKLTFSVYLEQPKRENHWDIWVYPPTVDTVFSEIQLSQSWDAARQALSEGKNVLFVPPASLVETDVELGFSSVFWNTSWTNGQAPHTLGMVIEDTHPVFNSFPTESHSDWQWWELVHGASAMILDGLPSGVKPLVQPIDTWFRSHKLALLFECKVGKGQLLVCSMDILSDLDERIVARQLLHSILGYMQSERFVPACVLCEEELDAVWKKEP